MLQHDLERGGDLVAHNQYGKNDKG
jgi:hypothetical protein